MQALDVWQRCGGLGFTPSWVLDLISGLPGLTPTKWHSLLETGRAASDHLRLIWVRSTNNMLRLYTDHIVSREIQESGTRDIDGLISYPEQKFLSRIFVPSVPGTVWNGFQ
jgi:hypothetical protein